MRNLLFCMSECNLPVAVLIEVDDKDLLTNEPGAMA